MFVGGNSIKKKTEVNSRNTRNPVASRVRVVCRGVEMSIAKQTTAAAAAAKRDTAILIHVFNSQAQREEFG